MSTTGPTYESYLARRAWMKGLLSKIPKKELIGAEIGVWRGYFICHLLAVEPRIKKIYAIDPTVGGKATINFSYLGNIVIPIAGRSEDVVDQIPSNLDFVTIDGWHKYEQVVMDIENYEPKILKGGLLCGHDYYGLPSEGVKKAVDEYAAKHKRKLYSIEQNVLSWWWYV